MKKYFTLVLALSGLLIHVSPIISQHNGQRTELPLTSVKPIDGMQYDVQKDLSIRGRVFESGFVLSSFGHVSFANRDDYDVFEAWIGRPQGEGRDEEEYRVVFRVLVDGEEVFRSPKMQTTDPALRVVVPIKGHTGISITTENEAKISNPRGIIGDPKMLKVSANIPLLVTPAVNERITGNTPLVWKPVNRASGYLLEIQCEKLSNPQDATRQDRFVTINLPSTTTIYNFNTETMPRGRWRWRVHSLNDTGFLGEAKEWRAFTVQ